MKRIDQYINRVIQGDCLDIMKDIPDKSIDMVLCDLPYGITNNPWDSIIDMNQLWKQYERLVKPHGVIVLNGEGMFTARLILSNPAMFRYKMVWIKSKAPNFLSANKQPLKKHEDVCVFYKKQPVYHPQMWTNKPYDRGIRKTNQTGTYGDFKASHCQSLGERYPYDLLFFEADHIDWFYFKTAESEGKSWHPTQKPVSLGRYLIRTYNDPGAVVLDNACGCGSFLVAAAEEGRSFIGIEKNELGFTLKTQPIDFIQITRQRLK